MGAQAAFDLPGSSWDDYDRAKISAGGGVWPRSAKSIALSAEMRPRLGTDAATLTPTELLSTILKAPVDLLWNGGIGTYVKCSTESNAAVGDRANDGLRVDGIDLRACVVGRAATSASPSSAGWSSPARRDDQHRRHRQLRWSTAPTTR